MRTTPNAHRSWGRLLLALIFITTAGCTAKNVGWDTDLSVRSRSNGNSNSEPFPRGIYRQDDPSSITVLLLDGPEDKPDRALIVRMFWLPRAGSTPLDETATNTTVQYIVFQPDATGNGKREVGIYSGGGFLYPETHLNIKTITANLWEATLTLTDKSDGFNNELGASVLQGRFTANRDDHAMVDALRRVNIAVSEQLDVPRFVRVD